jgi:hypothetical protein
VQRSCAQRITKLRQGGWRTRTPGSCCCGGGGCGSIRGCWQAHRSCCRGRRVLPCPGGLAFQLRGRDALDAVSCSCSAHLLADGAQKLPAQAERQLLRVRLILHAAGWQQASRRGRQLQWRCACCAAAGLLGRSGSGGGGGGIPWLLVLCALGSLGGRCRLLIRSSAIAAIAASSGPAALPSSGRQHRLRRSSLCRSRHVCRLILLLQGLLL